MAYLPDGRSQWVGAFLTGTLLLGAIVDPSPEVRSPSLQQSFQVVDSLRSAGNFQGALDRLSKQSQDRTQTVGVLWRRSLLWSGHGLSRLNSGDETAARSALQKGLTWADKALAADSLCAWAHLAKAAAAGRTIMLSERRRRKIQLSRQVKRHADRALALDSTLAPAYHVRGVWHRDVSDLGFLSQAVVRVVYGGLPEASLEQAAADLRRAVKLRPTASSHLELGKVYLKMERTEDARTQLRKALETAATGPFASSAREKAQTLLRELTDNAH